MCLLGFQKLVLLSTNLFEPGSAKTAYFSELLVSSNTIEQLSFMCHKLENLNSLSNCLMSLFQFDDKLLF